MAWLGFVTWITIYGCIYMAAITGRLGWFFLSGWLIPILALTVSFQQGMEVNGLMVLICVVMFFLCRRGLSEVRMWNIKRRKQHHVLFAGLYLLTLLFMLYSIIQAQTQGYLLNIQGWGSETMPLLRQLLTIAPLLLLNWVYAAQLYTCIDRLWTRRQELVLLSCNCFMANARGAEKIARQGYYLEGIQNGVTYHFELTKRSFHMLRKEKNLRLQIQTGLLGGMYVTELDNEEFLRRVRRLDRRNAKIGIFFLLPVIAAGVWLFWLR